LISTLSPQEMLTLRSCLIDPSPLLTLRVSRSRRPSANAVSFACSGERTSGAVATSTRGTPSLSRLYTTVSPTSLLLVSSFRAESSSNEIRSIPTWLESASICPSVATIVVLWKPLVLEPSTTVFLIACRFGIGFAPIRAAIVRTTSTASESWFLGGDSSSSMSPELGDWTYSKVLFLLCSNLAATSVSPPSPRDALSLRVERGQSWGISSDLYSKSSLGILE